MTTPFYKKAKIMEEGIVPGGGSVLLHARTNINVEDIGSQIVYNACAPKSCH